MSHRNVVRRNETCPREGVAAAHPAFERERVTHGQCSPGTKQTARSKAGIFLFYSWLVFLVAISFNAYDAYLRVTPSVTGEQLQRDLPGADASSLGTMVMFYFIPYVVLQIPVGLMVDRMGPRRLLALAAVISAAGSFLFGVALNLPMAYTARLLMGIGGAFPGVGPIYLASRWFPRRYLGALAGLTGTSTVIGSVGGEALLGWLLEFKVIDWKLASLLAGGAGLAVAAAIFLVVRDAPSDEINPHEAEPDPDANADAKTEVLQHLRGVLANPQNWINGIWGGMMLMPMLAFTGLYAVPFLARLYGITTAATATAVSSAFVGLAFGGPVAGMVSDRLRKRRWPMTGCSLAALVLICVVAYVPGVPFAAMYVLMFLLGFSLGSQGSLVFAVALEINPRAASGVAIGFTQGMSNLGGAVFPPLIGFLLTTIGGQPDDKTGYSVSDYQTALAVLPIGLAVALVASLCLKESYAAGGDDPDTPL